MKRSITMSVGALVLSQLLAFTALATPKCYSTGPLEEENSGTAEFFVKVLNSSIPTGLRPWHLGTKTRNPVGVCPCRLAPETPHIF